MEHDTAAKIINTAIPLFAKKGFVAVTIREVADAAQINSSAISYYFNGKEGLYHAALDKIFSPVTKLLSTVETMTAVKPVERLTLYARNIGTIHHECPFLARIIHSELANPTRCGEIIIKKYIAQLYQFACQSLREGIDSGEFSPDLNISYATISLAGIMNFYFLATPLIKEFAQLSEQSDEEYISQALRIYLNGIKVRENPQT
ncbi:MAG TPA: TetR family transcriptional regulator [Methylomusa anaerophila]|uniref:Putative HTH-type transcriptional regulator YttP n=1 Tax=Methylomusa anaerophila TaxID=1930071 RepID=A0A348AIR3_9FIRM|nr:TetR family transcriptional regulator [Methylomusa anaerophila]BBB90961.1 putative HTH-type transcriptional regulator YttP [Methylomusa anaerophila]HML90412.1 TetR family transcriptional regulator [Methylomusa anaerophila]